VAHWRVPAKSGAGSRAPYQGGIGRRRAPRLGLAEQSMVDVIGDRDVICICIIVISCMNACDDGSDDLSLFSR
jgi:hypothetical protein